MSKYALRRNNIITGFVIAPNDQSDQSAVNESSQEWLDYLAPDPAIAIEAAIASIVITVDGLKFIGNDDWQNKMARAVISSTSDAETTSWIMADGLPATVTSSQLKQALRLAGEEQRAIILGV